MALNFASNLFTDYSLRDSFVSFSGGSFMPTDETLSFLRSASSYQALADQTVSSLIYLPNGVTITEAIVYGDGAFPGNVWLLGRMDYATATVNWMAGTAMSAVDKAHSYTHIDNEKYSYFVQCTMTNTAIITGGFVRFVS